MSLKLSAVPWTKSWRRWIPRLRTRPWSMRPTVLVSQGKRRILNRLAAARRLPRPTLPEVKLTARSVVCRLQL